MACCCKGSLPHVGNRCPLDSAIEVVAEPMTYEEKIAQNTWHERDELLGLVQEILELSDPKNPKWSWVKSKNWACKYIELRIDMRDGAFVLKNRDGLRIDPEELRSQ